MPTEQIGCVFVLIKNMVPYGIKPLTPKLGLAYVLGLLSTDASPTRRRFCSTSMVPARVTIRMGAIATNLGEAQRSRSQVIY